MKAKMCFELEKLSGDAVSEESLTNTVNARLQDTSKETSITGFNDPTIANAKVVIDLVDAIKPGSIKYELVKDGETEEVGVLQEGFVILLFVFCILRVPLGPHEQRKVRNFNGAQDRSASVRASRGHRRGEAEDGHDRFRLPHDQGLPAGRTKTKRLLKRRKLFPPSLLLFWFWMNNHLLAHYVKTPASSTLQLRCDGALVRVLGAVVLCSCE